MKHRIKTLLTWMLSACCIALLCVGVLNLATSAYAQAADLADSTAQIAKPAAAAISTGIDILDAFLVKAPWIGTVLWIYGALSVAYQALIAWAHKKAAETPDARDNEWLASLEAKWWFRILDRVFYWGGYIGARLGGRKL